MRNQRKFLLITAFFFMCGVLMGLNVAPKGKTVKPEKVVVENKPILESIDSLTLNVDTIEVDSLPLREQVYNYLTIDKGLSRNHALGLIANGDRESLWRTEILGDRGTSGGIFQWHATRFHRLKQNVPDWRSNWKGQIDYALIESVGPEWCMKSFKSPQAAADWWMVYWEIPANTKGARIKNNQFLSSYNF